MLLKLANGKKIYWCFKSERSKYCAISECYKNFSTAAAVEDGGLLKENDNVFPSQKC
jgi:hypothetical protein